MKGEEWKVKDRTENSGKDLFIIIGYPFNLWLLWKSNSMSEKAMQLCSPVIRRICQDQCWLHSIITSS